ncbi:copper chaperone PCu(A)C [Murinocardiopsis flavida]|uniref:copper chaperone PCu(A)C n=1 Tax=Murinocardiopsis flavida TaxID=645275 RepID=UPI000D0CBE54|nr:copper chaperone PCu(A)C [Murinocardiopsis flavida]
MRIEGAWIPEPATPDMSTAYLKINNGDERDDALIAAETSASDDTDLCSTPKTDSGAARMRVVPEIPVPGGGSTELKSGGFHLMVNDIADPLTVGDRVTVTLTFDSGTEVAVEAPVLERTAGGGADDTGGDHTGHH